MRAFFILGISLVLNQAAECFASTSYTLPITDQVQVSDLRRAFPKIKFRPLFSESEQRALVRLKHGPLSQSLLVGPIDDKDEHDFASKLSAEFPALRLQKNEGISIKPILPSLQQEVVKNASFYAYKSTPTGDPLLTQQWALKNTGQEVRVDLDDLRTEALATVPGEDLDLPPRSENSGLKEVVVAVLDTGLDITHPDLKPMLRSKPDECEALTTFLDCLNAALAATPAPTNADAEKQCIQKTGNLDRDGNGYPLDCVGWSVVSSLSEDPKSPLSRMLGTPDMDDTLGHGTHVAGIIAAAQDNGIGVSGIAPNVKILPVRVIDSPPISPLRPQSLSFSSGGPAPDEASLHLGNSSVELIARGLLYAITEHVQIINLSLGWPAAVNSPVIEDMIKLAQEQGIAIVAAAGNDSTDALVLPCSLPGVICVGSYGPDGKRALYSNRGPGVDLLAPGTSILSTYPLSLRAHFYTDLAGYEIMSGTSMSAPMVAGSLALLLGRGYSLDESLARLIAGARVSGDAVGENLRLDLNRSLNLQPRPLLRVSERAPVRLNWTQRDEILQGKFHVKNLWKNITNCSVSYHLSAPLNSVSDQLLKETLATSAQKVDCGQWQTGQERTVPFSIQLLSPRANRDFRLNVELDYTSGPGLSYHQTLQVGVQIAPSPDLINEILGAESTSIQGMQAGKGTMVRTLVAVDQKSVFSKPEYVVLSRLGDDIGFQILSSRNSTDYQYSAPQKITDLTWNFLVGQRFYSPEAKATRIALIFKKSDEVTKITAIRFDIYDENLTHLIRSISYDGSYAPLPENFRWTSLNGKDAILFVSTGKEAPSTDVWHQVPDLTVILRCYVLDANGVLSTIQVNPNDLEYRIVDLLPYRAEDTEKGENALLVIHGKDYVLDYFIGHFNEGKVLALDPFTIAPYRNMGFLKASPLLNESGPAPGNVLSSNEGRGKLRSTVLLRPGYKDISNGDFRFSPLESEDSVNRIVGGFQLSGRNSFFAQADYDLELHEFASNQESIVKTSMARFSFLPSLVTQQAFFPILVNNEAKLPEPALLTEDIGSGFFSLSAIVPARDTAGRLLGLLRPAVLSFEGNENGCSFIGNPVWDLQNRTYRMNSFCGDSIRSVRLQMPLTLH